MSWRWLESYERGTRVTPGTAKTDRIDLVIGDWLIGAEDTADLPEFFGHLIRRRSTHGTLGPRFDHDHETYFTPQSASANLSCPRLVMTAGGRGSRSELRRGRPLVYGTLNAQRLTGRVGLRSVATELCRLTLDLKLNVTRFVHHQPLEPYWRRPQMADWGELGAPSLFASQPMLQFQEERSLDRKDNVLIGRGRISFGRPEAWSMHTRRYWTALLSWFDTLFNNAARHAHVDFGRQGDLLLNLRAVETYWEFQVPDPLEWVMQAERPLRQLGQHSVGRTYQADSTPDELPVNSRSIKVKLRSGVYLRVYAKTTHRIRMEIEHELKENASAIGGRHTARGPDALYVWLDRLSVDAADMMNLVLAHLEANSARSTNEFSRSQLVIRLINRVGNEALGESIISTLSANGSIMAQADDAMKEAVQKLKRANILMSAARNSRRYVLTPQYRRAGLELSTLVRANDTSV